MSGPQSELGFEFHRAWVEKLLDTPSPRSKNTDGREDSLTCESPTEHVLRGSKSFAARSFRSRTHTSSVHFAASKPNDENISVFVDPIQEPAPPVIATSKPQVLGEISNNGQAPRFGQWRLPTSPTPSIRKSKIDALVKHHGSPQHVRVTAGGRIVPSEQSPLCHPRFGYSAIKSNGALIKVAPNHIGKAQWISATQDGYVAQDINGRLCQIVSGTIMPLNEEDGAVRLYVPAPNLNITQRGPSVGAHAAFEDSTLQEDHQGDSQGGFIAAPPPTVAAQKNALDLEYLKLERDLKDLDKTEVLHGGTMAKTAKDALFTKRRELVTGMDRVRKALKSLKEFPIQAHVPTSPKAMRDGQSMSPQRDRLPPFLQRARQSTSISTPSMQGPWHYLGPPMLNSDPSLTGPPFGMPVQTSANAPFSAMSYQMPPPGAFVPPPPFDGSMGAPFSAYQGPVGVATSTAADLRPDAGENTQSAERLITQQDGSSSSSDIKFASPRQSHALPIKDPATKQITNVKSILNPMSPVYKPSSNTRQTGTLSVEKASEKQAGDRAPTPLTVVNPSRPVVKASPGTDSANRVSPTKRNMPNDTSSASSVRTADFFPRNTRDYSLRKHEYPIATDESEERENIDPDRYRRIITESQSPITPKRDLHNSNWNPEIPDGAFVKFASPQTGSYAAPTAPPGTPVNAQLGDEQRQPVLKFGSADWDGRLQYLNDAQMPDRVAHNLSPKNKRTWRFVEEQPSRYGSEDNSSPTREHQCREDLCSAASPYKTADYSDKSRDWIEGHQAGLYRKPIGADRMGDFLDGYCTGLLKSQPITSVSMGISDGSPVRPLSRRPTPSPGQSTPHQVEQEASGTVSARPAMELSLKSLDSLKQAVYAPHNENALMTPAVEAPSNEAPYHLGAWQKRHEKASGLAPQYPIFPLRASSLTERRPNLSFQSDDRRDSTQDSDTPFLQKAAPMAQSERHLHAPKAPPLAAAQPRVVSGPAYPAERINSITSIDSTLSRPWPGAGPRVISPFEWKSTSSVAHAANLATGYFAHAQYDGTAMDLPDTDRDAMLTHAAGISGALTNNNEPSVNDWQHRNASLDGMDSPRSPASPPPASPNLSPNTSPRLQPAHSKKDSQGHSPSKKSSPTKSPSPAKAKFEHIASKIGIGSSAEKRERQDTGAEASPPTKRGWRDIWGSSKKDASKDDGAAGASGAASPSH